MPKVRFVRTHPDAILPTQGTPDAVGYDLYAVKDFRIPTLDDILHNEKNWVIADTGWKVAVEDGYEAQIRPRSGNAARHGVTVLNTPGTIDPDYRGDLKVILVNLSPDYVYFKKGDRIAQLVVAPVTKAEMVEVTDFEDTTDRGESGFGSTGQ